MNGAELTLEYPIQGPMGRIEKITIRRPKVRDQVAAQEGGGSAAEQELRLFSFITGQPPEVIGEMDYADYLALQKKFTGFLPPRTKEA